MYRMKLLTVCLVAGAFSNSLFAGDPIEALMEGCDAEIKNYCSQVTLGEGRLLACFYAHEDKLSNQCIHAVYDAAVALEEAVDALVYIASSCETDIDEFCGGIEAGDGAILNCLTAERESISETCSTALNDVENE